MADANLMPRVAAGDRAAFEQLYDAFSGLVYSIARGMLRDDRRAEDAAQDAWIKVWNAAGSFDPQRASVATWITTLTHRHVIDAIRHERVRSADRPGSEPGDDVAARQASRDDVAGMAIDKAYGEDIRSAMDGLRAEYRTVIELTYFGGYTQREIAEQLAKPIGTIKTYMYQGMRQLRELLDEQPTPATAPTRPDQA